MRNVIARRIGGVGTLGMWLALLALLPVSATATTSGPGTEFLACRAQSWADYNDCLMRNQGSKLGQWACDKAWDIDNIGCDIALLLAILPG